MNKIFKQTIAATKVIAKANSNEKTMLNIEVMQAVRTAGVDTSIANAKAKLAVELYGEEHLGKGAKVREIRKRLLDEFAGYSAIPADIFKGKNLKKLKKEYCGHY